MLDYVRGQNAAIKAPVLWGHYRNRLNDIALEALADVILSPYLLLEDTVELIDAFHWSATPHGAQFWSKVQNGEYDRSADAPPFGSGIMDITRGMFR